MREHRLYYWGTTDRSHKGPRNNFGDILSPSIFRHFKVAFEEAATHDDSNIISAGSVARLAKDGDIVVGSGIIRGNEDLNPRAVWKSVRGPLTRDRVLECGGECPEVFGDPALLLPLFCPEREKKHKTGLVPHYQHLSRSLKCDGMHVIDVRCVRPESVANRISECERIVSSSLHGIIAAHAYGIPAAWLDLGGLHGDGSKFRDHYLSVGLEAEPSTIGRPLYSVPSEINLNPLVEVFESL